MNQPLLNHLAPCLLALLIMGSPTGSRAQDARALELLNGLTPQTNNSRPAPAEPLETFDYTLHYTIYSDKTAKAAENYLRFAVDTERRLLYTDRVIGRTPNFKLVYKDGRVTAYDLRAGETFTPPENLVAPFKRWFDQVAYPDIREQDLREARYLGEKGYGEIALYEGDNRYEGTVQGEVVEVTAAIPDFLGTSLGRVPVKLIFDDRGDHIASVYTVEGEQQLVVYNDPDDPEPLPRYLNAHLYRLGTPAPFLEARTRLRDLSLNEPLDPDLFGGAATPDAPN
jgi:hypothetical protein